LKIRAQALAWLLVPVAAIAASPLEQALAQRRQGHFSQAIAAMRDLLRANPGNAQDWYELGLSYAMAGQYGGASDAYRQAIAHGRQDGQCHCALSLALRESGRPTSAMAEARQCLKLLPAYAGAWNLVGNCDIDMGRLDGALEAYKKAVTLSPGYVNARFNLALTLQALQRYAGAEAQFKLVLGQDGAMAEAWTGLGSCQLGQGRPRDALASYAAAQRLRPKDPDLQWGLSRAWSALGDVAQAAEHAATYKKLMREKDAHGRH
jgi:tetratricopeptide (TPR) repeat protein